MGVAWHMRMKLDFIYVTPYQDIAKRMQAHTHASEWTINSKLLLNRIVGQREPHYNEN